MKESTRGITVIEILIAMTLVLLALLALAQTLIVALDVEKKSRLRLHLHQAHAGEIQRLSSLSFDDEEVSEGGHGRRQDGEYLWYVEDLSPTLKRIQITTVLSERRKRSTFLKSKYFPGFSCLSGGVRPSPGWRNRPPGHRDRSWRYTCTTDSVCWSC